MTTSDISMSPKPLRRSASRSRSPAPRKRSVSRGRSPSISRSKDRSMGDSRSRSRSPAVKLGPSLIRIFVKPAPGFHPIEDFEDGMLPLKDEYAVYAWPDSSIHHILSLLYTQFPPQFKLLNCRYNFRHVFFDPSGSKGRERSWKWKDAGSIVVRDILRDGGDSKQSRTLGSLRWQQGDYLCVSVFTPSLGGNVVIPPSNIPQGPTSNPTQSREFGWTARSSLSNPPPIAINEPRRLSRGGPVDSPADGNWTKAREDTAALPNQGLPPPFSIRGRGGGGGGGAGRGQMGMNIRGGGGNGGDGAGERRRRRSRSPDYTRR